MSRTVIWQEGEGRTWFFWAWRRGCSWNLSGTQLCQVDKGREGHLGRTTHLLEAGNHRPVFLSLCVLEAGTADSRGSFLRVQSRCAEAGRREASPKVLSRSLVAKESKCEASSNLSPHRTMGPVSLVPCGIRHADPYPEFHRGWPRRGALHVDLSVNWTEGRDLGKSWFAWIAPIRSHSLLL
jgi:hypothetical protein